MRLDLASGLRAGGRLARCSRNAGRLGHDPGRQDRTRGVQGVDGHRRSQLASSEGDDVCRVAAWGLQGFLVPGPGLVSDRAVVGVMIWIGTEGLVGRRRYLVVFEGREGVDALTVRRKVILRGPWVRTDVDVGSSWLAEPPPP